LELHRVRQEKEDPEEDGVMSDTEGWTGLKINNAAESVGDRRQWSELVHHVTMSLTPLRGTTYDLT